MAHGKKKYPFVAELLLIASIIFLVYRVIVGIMLVVDSLAGEGIRQIVEGFFIASLGLTVAYIAMRLAPE